MQPSYLLFSNCHSHFFPQLSILKNPPLLDLFLLITVNCCKKKVIKLRNMWMMGYNDGGDFNMGDAHPFGSRKLRPLMPRPLPATTSNPPCLGRIHGTDFIALNHNHLAAMAEQSKREFNTQQVVVSSRWNPTPEQLQTLEELYRRGTRTPSAEQIQHITGQLRRFGKIEGKNVFYWFQNHKARERQKRRRQLKSSSDNEQPLSNNTENIEKKDSGSSRTVFEVEQNKNWETPTNHCSSTHPEKTVPIEMAASKTGAERTGVECRAAEDGWLHFDHHADHNLQNQRCRRINMIMERNDTWQNLINSTITTTPLCSSPTVTTVDPKNYQEYVNIFLDSPSRTRNDGHEENGEVCFQESPTLQLFPLRSENEFQGKETQIIGSSNDESMDTPYQFFEFLPVKN